MIVWINGAFGSGKTQTAYELSKRVRDSFVFDPENAGFYIGNNLPQQNKIGDFQDYDMWRKFNNMMIKYIELNYKGTVFVPMTVTNKRYLKEMMDNVNVQHITLIAQAQTLHKRLRSRGEKKNSWGAQQINRCVKCFEDPEFEIRIDTDNLSIDQVVEKIAYLCEIELLADNRSNIKKTIDRILVWKKHIRLFNISG